MGNFNWNQAIDAAIQTLGNNWLWMLAIFAVMVVIFFLADFISKGLEEANLDGLIDEKELDGK